ncbi:MAG TPA: zinc ribbon domain-containing protein, partial [Polyangiaceae bacterium]|nr:zinc ribbon domain-containing protein [Polyangiaceae bacterium]
MFCPNCGTENDDAATTCKKCGFNLKGAAAPKFKGTMLMMNSPQQGTPRPGAPAPGPAAAPPPGPAPAGPPPGAPAPAPAAPRQQLKGTMLGVAPPGMGGYSPPAAPAAPPVAPPGPQFAPTPAAAFGAQPMPPAPPAG